MQEAIESFGGVPGVKAVFCTPPLSSIKKPVKWDGVSFVNNFQYGEEGVSMEILQSWKRQIHSLEQVSRTRTKFQRWNAVEQAKTYKLILFLSSRDELRSLTSQKHQDSSDEGTDDSSEESRDSTTKNIFSARKRVALSPINANRYYRSISNVGMPLETREGTECCARTAEHGIHPVIVCSLSWNGMGKVVLAILDILTSLVIGCQCQAKGEWMTTFEGPRSCC